MPSPHAPDDPGGLAALLCRLSELDGEGAPAQGLLAASLEALVTHTSAASGCLITFLDDQGERVDCTWSPGAVPPPPDVMRHLRPLWRAVLGQRQALRHDGLPAPAFGGWHSLVMLPLRSGGQAVGVVGLVDTALTEAAAAALHPALALLAQRVQIRRILTRQHQAEAALLSAEENLRVSEKHYEQLFEAAGVGIARLSLDGYFLEVNQRFAEITGRTRDELLKLGRADITHPDDLAADEALAHAALQGEATRQACQKRYLRPDGQEVWVMLTLALVRDAEGQPLHFVCVTEDVTERRRFEEAMTSAMAAERANKAKTDFLSRMSHELRTPLNAMLGFAQLLRVDPSNPLNEPQRAKVGHIERAGAHLLAMLTDVLDLSRIEAGGLPLSLEPLRVATVLEEAVALVTNQVGQAELQLVHTPPDPDLFVKADQVRLRQIMVNLLSNAIKYNRPGGRVMVDAQPQQNHVVITVSDTGRGLAEDQLAHLFEPFNRLGAERTPVEGTGIGLVIVKRLVDLMRGHIEVTSQPNMGTSFRVWLPAARNPSPREDVSRAGRSGFGALDATGADTFTLLYAEDNTVNVELVRQVLHMRPKWQLDVARNGAQAIEMTRAQPPDVLLLDMHLGDMTGLEVSDALTRYAHTAGIPRVALSADAMPDQITAARARGFVDYLTKPLQVDRLLKLLDRLGDEIRAAREDADADSDDETHTG